MSVAIVHVTKSNVFIIRFCVARVTLDLQIILYLYSQLVMHDTANNTNTLLWAPSVAQHTSNKTSIDSAHRQLRLDL